MAAATGIMDRNYEKKQRRSSCLNCRRSCYGNFCDVCRAEHEKNKARYPQPEKKKRAYSSNQRVYNSKGWLHLRRRFRKDNPFCARCKSLGQLTAATQTDHVIPIKVNPALIYDINNLQALCHKCHAKKGAYEKLGKYIRY